MTYDKNGTIIKCGDIVEIKNAYFKNDCGFWFVEQDGTNESYYGRGLTLRKIGKTGKISTAKYNLAFWPLSACTNDREKNAAARDHNAHNATIEVIKHISNAAIIDYIRDQIKEINEGIDHYKMRGYDETFTESHRNARDYWTRALERLTQPTESPETDEATPAPAESPTDAPTAPEEATAGETTITAGTATPEATQTPTESEALPAYNDSDPVVVGMKFKDAAGDIHIITELSNLAIIFNNGQHAFFDFETRRTIKDVLYGLSNGATLIYNPATAAETTPAQAPEATEAAATIITEEEPTASPEAATEAAPAAVYRYGMMYRGFSIGCQPRDGFIDREDDNSGLFYDIISYNRELTPEEVANYELTPIVDTTPGADQDAQPEETAPEATETAGTETAAETPAEGENAAGTTAETEPEELPDSYYIENKETGKLELHFEKSDYMELSDSQKQTIKSNFLFSRRSSAWISRCKFPNLYRARKAAEDIGLYNAGSTGDRLSFEEQQERKADRAEARAERMEARADKAIERSKALQAPIERMRGDIAFFTQPNINTTAGRAFTRQRERMWASWERGIEEFRKSDYYRQKAETARETADKTKTQDKGFCQRRINEAEKTIKAQKRNIEHYQKDYIERLDNGETISRLYSDKPITRPEVEKWIEDAEDIIIEAYGKIAYYDALIQAAGGIIDRDTLSKGDLVIIKRWSDPVKIIRKGPKNFTYEFTTPHMKYADGRPMQGGAAYAEIEKII